MIHHYLLFIGYQFNMENGSDGEGCSAILATLETENDYELKEEFDKVIEEAIVYRTQKFKLKSCDILCLSVVHHWIEGQDLDRPKTHNFIIFAQGIYRKRCGTRDKYHRFTFNFSLSVQDDLDLQIKFQDAVEDMINQQKLSLDCEKYCIVGLEILSHNWKDL